MTNFHSGKHLKILGFFHKPDNTIVVNSNGYIEWLLLLAWSGNPETRFFTFNVVQIISSTPLCQF